MSNKTSDYCFRAKGKSINKKASICLEKSLSKLKQMRESPGELKSLRHRDRILCVHDICSNGYQDKPHTTNNYKYPIDRIPCTSPFCYSRGNGTPLQYSCLENPMDRGAWQAAVHGVAKSRSRLSDLTFTFHFHALKKEMATHSSVLACRIPGMGEPGGLPSMGSHRVRHD